MDYEVIDNSCSSLPPEDGIPSPWVYYNCRSERLLKFGRKGIVVSGNMSSPLVTLIHYNAHFSFFFCCAVLSALPAGEWRWNQDCGETTGRVPCQVNQAERASSGGREASAVIRQQALSVGFRSFGGHAGKPQRRRWKPNREVRPRIKRNTLFYVSYQASSSSCSFRFLFILLFNGSTPKQRQFVRRSQRNLLHLYVRQWSLFTVKMMGGLTLNFS